MSTETMEAVKMNETRKAQVQSASKIRMIASISMLSAIAAVLMLFEFPIVFIAPSFYKLDFSEVPVLIGAFAFGPIAGIAIELVKILLNLVLNGTLTFGVGELANFLIGCALVAPASIIYSHRPCCRNSFYGRCRRPPERVPASSVLCPVHGRYGCVDRCR